MEIFSKIMADAVSTATNSVLKKKHFKLPKKQLGGTVPGEPWTPKGTDSYGRSPVGNLNWRKSDNFQYDFGDPNMNKKVLGDGQGSHYYITRDDISDFYNGNYTSETKNALLNMLPSYRKQVLDEFKKDEKLNALYANDFDISRLPELWKDKSPTVGSVFSIVGRGYGNDINTEEIADVAVETLAPETHVLKKNVSSKNPPPLAKVSPFYASYAKPGTEEHKKLFSLIKRKK